MSDGEFVGRNLGAEVRSLLMEQRAIGVDFDTAWVRSMYAVLGERGTKPPSEAGTSERAQWRIALECCEPDFRDAYHRRPSRRAEAVALLAGLLTDAGVELGIGPGI